MIKIKVEKAKLDEAFTSLSKAAGTSMKQVLFHEGIAITKKVSKYNKPATSTAVRAGANYRAVRDNNQGFAGKMTVNTGRRGGVPSKAFYKKIGQERAFYLGEMDGEVLSKKGLLVGHSKIHLSLAANMVGKAPSDVGMIIAKAKASASALMSTALNSRGLTAKTWWDAAIMISSASGIKLSKVLPSITFKFGDATTVEGTYLHVTNVSTKWTLSGGSLVITNNSTLARNYGKGQKQVDRAMRERASGMKRALVKGWFEDASYIAKNYPGLIVKE